MLAAEVFVGKTTFHFGLIKILVASHPTCTSVVGRVVVVSALLLLTSMLEIVALRVATALVEAALFLLKISSAVTRVMPTLVSSVKVATFVVATFPEDTLVV